MPLPPFPPSLSPSLKSPCFSRVSERLASQASFLSCGKRVFTSVKTKTSGDGARVWRRQSSTTESCDSRPQQERTERCLSGFSSAGLQSITLLGSRQTLAFSGFIAGAPGDATARPPWPSGYQTGNSDKGRSLSPNVSRQLPRADVERTEATQEGVCYEAFVPPSGRIGKPVDAGYVENSEQCPDIGEILLSTPTTLVFNKDRRDRSAWNGGPKQRRASSGSWLFPGKVANESLKLFNGIDVQASGAIAFFRDSSLLSLSNLGTPRCVPVYLAVLRGHMPVDVVHCRSSVCRPSPGSREWRLAGERTEGKAAYSIFRPIVQAALEAHPVTLVEIRLVQGPPIVPRLHAASLGHSVIGDPTYGPEVHRRRHHRCDKPLMLHCWILKIAPPYAQEEVCVEAPDTLSTELGMKPRTLADCSLVDDSVVNPVLSFFENHHSTEGIDVNANADTCVPSGESRGNIARNRAIAVACDSPLVPRDIVSNSSGPKNRGLPSKYGDNNTYWDKLGGGC
uniref:Putative pseudouridine synthase n=1 Tax=Toxoplasma gondii COUG TaxID=1074873 RepID=A0A2G8YE65_TOXGO|nr:putative pseudouridine synthase [Toxoplasma gondii COUG]